MLGLGAAALAPEAAIAIRHEIALSERDERPKPIVGSPLKNSLVHGTAPNNNNVTEFMQSGGSFGRLPHIANFFLDQQYPELFSEIIQALEETFPQISLALESGILPMISCAPGKIHPNPSHLDIEGLVDFASRLKKLNRPFLFRPFYEINTGTAQKWYGEHSPRDFQEYWKIVYDVFHLSEVEAYFVFNVNSTTMGYPIEWYYPGDEYVDLNSGDFYYKYSPFLGDPRHYLYLDLPPEYDLGPDIATFQNIAPNKPFILSEINAIDNDVWVKNAINFAINHGAVGWVSFEWIKSGIGETDWRLRRSPRMPQIMAEELSKEYYLDSGVPEQTIETILSSYIIRNT